MDKQVVIIHFQPLELYPPAMNLLSFIATRYPSRPVTVCTTFRQGKEDAFFEAGGRMVTIKRLVRMDKELSGSARYLNYVLFYIRCLAMLIRIKPAAILYFETMSSFPAWFYRRWINPKVPVFIHYHEYSSPAEYAGGMKLNRYFHTKERWLYSRAGWISHTNAERMSLFLKDIAATPGLPVHILPNYPSEKWDPMQRKDRALPARVVYVGALSMDTMFVEEFAHWVDGQRGRVIWHIYSGNITEEAKAFLEGGRSACIQLYPAVEYASLPVLLEKYDVGVILYKGHIPNYVYNAPNKLFEYLAAGLDVWFPAVMKGCMPYTSMGTFPKVLSIDFNRLEDLRPEEAMSVAGLRYQQPRYYFEDVLPALTDRLFNQ